MTFQAWNDERVEKIIGNLLSAGVFLAASVVFTGGVIFLSHHGRASTDYHLFTGEPAALKSVAGILHYALQWHGSGIIQFGLLLLIATPVARVAFSIVGFAAQHDPMYVGFTLLVLIVLLFSLFGWSPAG